MFTKGNSKIRKALSSNIARLRKTKIHSGGQTWSQAHLAKEAGLSIGTIQKIESGATWPDWKTVVKLADVLGVHVDEFYMGTKESVSLDLALEVVNKELNIDLAPRRPKLKMDKEFFFDSLKAEVEQIESELPQEVHTALDELVQQVIDSVG